MDKYICPDCSNCQEDGFTCEECGYCSLTPIEEQISYEEENSEKDDFINIEADLGHCFIGKKGLVKIIEKTVSFSISRNQLQYFNNHN